MITSVIKFQNWGRIGWIKFTREGMRFHRSLKLPELFRAIPKIYFQNWFWQNVTYLTFCQFTFWLFRSTKTVISISQSFILKLGELHINRVDITWQLKVMFIYLSIWGYAISFALKEVSVLLVITKPIRPIKRNHDSKIVF